MNKKEFTQIIKNATKELASKKDIKALDGKIGIVQYEMRETNKKIGKVESNTNTLLNLMDRHAKTHETLEQEFSIVKSRLDQIEKQLGIKEIYL